MELLQIRDFGKAGLVSDLPAWDLSLSAFTDAKNFRIVGNKVQSFGGKKTLESLPAGFVPGLLKYTPNGTIKSWLLAGRSKIYSYDGSAFSDITMEEADEVEENRWVGTQIGRIPVLSNRGTSPMFWWPNDGSTPMQSLVWDNENSLTWESENIKCYSMRSFGSYLIALGIIEGADEYSDLIRWSDPALVNEVPANWVPGPGKLANRVALGGDGGAIIDGYPLRNSFVIYRQRGITVLDFTDDNFVFSLNHQTTTTNLVNINCIAEIKGIHYLMSAVDILVNDGNKLQSILHNVLRQRYASSFNDEASENAFCLHNILAKEFWAFIPTGTSQYATEAWCYNYRDKTWSIHEVDSPVAVDYGGVHKDVRTWATWDETWETSIGPWGQRSGLLYNTTVFGVKNGSPGALIQLDDFVSETEFTTRLERTDFPLTSMQDVVSIQRIYPHITGTIPVEITVGSQQYAGGPVAWKDSVSFMPGVDRKIDVRTTGELFALRIQSSGIGNWKLSGLDIEWVPAGYR